MKCNEIYHHGILGMKWGVRRFQNEDGSLTAAGKQRYYSDKESKEIYDQLQKSAYVSVKKSPLFKIRDLKVDYKSNEAINDAGHFLKSQCKIIKGEGNALLDKYRNEFDKVYDDPKARSEIMSHLRDMYGQFDGEFMMDDFGVSFAVAEYLDEKFYKIYSKDEQQYAKMIKLYDENVSNIAKDLVGSYGNLKISAVDKSGLFKKTEKVSFETMVTRSLEKLSGSSWDFPTLDYDQDDMGGYEKIIGDRKKKFDQYCQKLADEFNKHKKNN